MAVDEERGARRCEREEEETDDGLGGCRNSEDPREPMLDVDFVDENAFAVGR